MPEGDGLLFCELHHWLVVGRCSIIITFSSSSVNCAMFEGYLKFYVYGANENW